MLKGTKGHDNTYADTWVVPSSYHLSALWNIPEIVLWPGSIGLFVVGQMVGLVGLLDAGIVLAGLIVSGATALIAAFFVLGLVIFGNRQISMNRIHALEDAYSNMSKKDRKYFKTYLKNAHRHPSILAEDVTELFKEHEETRVNEVAALHDRIKNDLKNVKAARKIYEDSMAGVKEIK